MDTAMRDLERIREHEPMDSRMRRWGVWGLAALTTTALVVALGMMLDGTKHDQAQRRDPLAAVDGIGKAPAQDGSAKDPEVDRQSLTFPTALTEERPEVAAAVAAAGAELAHPDPVGGSAFPPRHEAPPTAPVDPVPSDMPVADAAAPGATVLAQTVLDDPLMARAEAHENDAAKDQAASPKGPVTAGHDGKYTLQVISYRSADEANLFARTLRERGHHAFVMSADLGDRGRYWRVRIGPFRSLKEADDYRADFEKAEGMNTYVVKNKDEDQKKG